MKMLKKSYNIMKEVIAFVHAKGTSKRVPNKNLRILGHLPLFCHAIRNAQNSKLVTKVVIDSDSDEILNIGSKLGAVPLKRPAKLADNNTTGDHLAYWQASNYPDSEIILQVVPTSPFLYPTSIGEAIRMIYVEGVDSIAGVFREVFYEWIDGKPAYFSASGDIPNSFEKKPFIYETMGLCIARTKFVLANKKRINVNSCLPYFLSRIESIDINTIEDFKFAEIVWKGKKNAL
jgi:CMP-N-acetylneuraminic acid synthetase